MTHLKRAGIILFLLLLVLFIVPRVAPVPDFLLEFGFHRSDRETNQEQWASLPMQYANTTICNNCHQLEYESWQQADHSTVSCENCHGPAYDHLEGNALPVVNRTSELCATCHASLISRPVDFPQVDIEEHAGEVECVTCHNPHDPREGIPPQLPHTMEGRENCQSCHNPQEAIPRVPPVVPHTLEGRSDCVSCHDIRSTAQVTVPLIPHSLEGRDDCLLCHNASAIKPYPENHAGRTTDTCRGCHQTE